MRVIINPGTGPVEDATPANAWANMIAFTDEVANRPRALAASRGKRLRMTRAAERDYGDGRWAYLLSATPDGPGVEVQMPGTSLTRVRDDRSIWQPRIYVDGSSWYWSIAVSVAADAFFSPPDDAEAE